jgi:hypothetical protein
LLSPLGGTHCIFLLFYGDGSFKSFVASAFSSALALRWAGAWSEETWIILALTHGDSWMQILLHLLQGSFRESKVQFIALLEREKGIKKSINILTIILIAV